MNILVTGYTGFVGQNLTRYLSTTNLDFIYNLSKAELLNAEDYLIDILSDNKINAIIHLAGKAHDLKQQSNSKEYFEINFELTKKLYNAFLRSTAQKFIFISSVKAVADKVTDILYEDATPDPKTDYGKSKLAAEQHIQSMQNNDNNGKLFYILRPCMIHGPGNKGNLNLLYKIAKTGFPYPLAAFENRRSFLSIDNLSFIIKELIEKENIPSGVYNVADDVPLSTNQIIRIIGEEASKKTRLLRVNKNLIKTITYLGDILPLPINSERLRKLTESFIVSNSKLVTALQKELPISSENGLRLTIQSFLRHDG